MFKRLALTIWTPNRAFEDIGENPTYLGAFILIGLGSIVVASATLPVFQKMYLLSVTESLNPGQLERLYRYQKTMRYVYPVGTLIGILFFWFISAFLIWLIAPVFECRGRFKSIFSVISHASITSLISSILVAAIIYFRASKGLTGLSNLEIKLGADLFISSPVHPALQIVLANLNPFTFWYYALLTIGIATVCEECSRVRAAGVVGTFWAISMAFSAGIAWVFSVFQALDTAS